MSIIRQDLATKDWTIFSPNRAFRPEEYKKMPKPLEIEDYSVKCPFCRGNESMTPKELFSIKIRNKWLIKVVPNKYPVLQPKELIGFNIERKISGPYLNMDGIGSHEVVIESPNHSEDLVSMKIDHIEKIIRVYRLRYFKLSKNKDYQLVIIFRNHGEIAGSSIKHPHSQIVSLPFVPNHVRNKLFEAQRYFDDSGNCVYCDMIKYELKTKERIINENKDFIAFAPYASVVPYHIIIMPKKHFASFIETPENLNKSLATILQVVLKKLHSLLGNPDYNYVIDSSPLDKSGQRNYHWHLEILPRLTTRAGFQIGSGVSINTILPEDCAKYLRNFKI
jgi:UDPglucose--hexose-1-phosphate uridylyltransferase